MTFAERFSPYQIAQRFADLKVQRQALDELTQELAERRAHLAALDADIVARDGQCRGLVATSIYAQET